MLSTYFSWCCSSVDAPHPHPPLSLSIALALFPSLFCIFPLSSSEYQYWIFCVILWLVQYFSELFQVMPPLGPASANKILKKVQMKKLVCGLWYTVVCCFFSFAGFSCGGSWTDFLRHWKKSGTYSVCSSLVPLKGNKRTHRWRAFKEKAFMENPEGKWKAVTNKPTVHKLFFFFFWLKGKGF